eukprot:1042418_1
MASLQFLKEYETQSNNQKQITALQESNTIRIAPIPRTVSESNIYDFIMTAIENEPISINILKPKKCLEESDPLYDVEQSFIVLQSKEDAINCQTALNETQFAGFTCSVSVCPSRNKYMHCINSRDKVNWVKLTGLENKTTEQNILTHIQKHVPQIADAPKSIYLCQHQTKPNYVGYAFIECASASDATHCVMELNKTVLNGMKVWCTWRPIARDRNRRETMEGQTKQVVVSNLHYLLEEDNVKQLCGEYGVVEEVCLWKDKAGYPSGVALCTMKHEQDATKVFEGLQGKEVNKLNLKTGYINKERDNKEKKLMKEVLKNKQIVKKVVEVVEVEVVKDNGFSRARAGYINKERDNKEKKLMKEVLKNKQIVKKVVEVVEVEVVKDNGFSRARAGRRGGTRGRGRGGYERGRG